MSLFNIFLDCGAPSLYNQLGRTDKSATYMGSFLADRKGDDFSFIETEEYKQYMDDYIAFVRENKQHINTYVNLDVINNPKATWRNQMYMEERGIKPVPVFHFGSDLKWLKRYLDRGYDHIAIGGMVPNKASVLIPALDEIWGDLLTDKGGMPLVKVHGFAATSPRLIKRYPWYSVDSTSWLKMAAYGKIYVPLNHKGDLKYDRNPHIVSISAQVSKQKRLPLLAPAIIEEVTRYVESKGFKVGLSSFDKDGEEIIEEPGLCNDRTGRAEINAIYFIDLVGAYAWPRPFIQKAKKGFNL